MRSVLGSKVMSHLRTLRLQLGLRQRDVANEVGVTAHQMRKWERGLDIPPTNVIQALAALFDVCPRKMEAELATAAGFIAPGEGYVTARTDARSVEIPVTSLPPNRMRVLDLFCGAGGLSQGLELTGHFATVAGLDLLPDRVKSFSANHPHAIGIIGDIHDYPARRLTEIAGCVDVIVGGPPCQGFSSIRPFRKLTEGDRRNNLVEQFLLLVSAIKPKWFVFENVVGVLTHRQGRILKMLMHGFLSAGYETSWRVMNAALYGVPQNRERLVIVGNRTGVSFAWPSPRYGGEFKSMAGNRPEVIRPNGGSSRCLPPPVTLMQSIGDLPVLKAGETAESYVDPPQTPYQSWARGEARMLTLHGATRHSKRMLEIIRHSGPNVSAIPPHLISSGFSSCYSRLSADSPSTTLTVNFVHPASNRCIHPTQDRAITPREGARIQSFPDTFIFRGTRAQVVKQIGNAVPPLLAKAIGEAIAESES